MKQLLFLFCTTVILFFLSENSALSRDNSKNDFNIVLITIDALRADHLSCYGYDRKTSPNIDKIAENGIIFKNAIAPSSWTAPSMVSLLTSVYPINHGVVHGFMKGRKVYRQEVFSEKLITLAQILNKHGYTTFGVASNLHLSENLGFARGFDYFKCLSFLPAHPVNNSIYSWESEIKKSDKYFLWVHYFDPHNHYHARTPWIEQYTSMVLTKKLKLFRENTNRLLDLIPMFKEDPQALSNLIALYDSEINFVDSYIGELIQRFALDKNTLIIITSDHGEGFLEHGMLDHGHDLYAESINIPLIIKLPQQTTKKVITQQASLIDIMPTILSLLNIPHPEQAIGEPLITPNGETADSADRFLSIELEKGNRNMKAILTKEWKYIFNYKEKKEEFPKRLKRAWNEDWRYLFNYKEVIEGLYDRKQDSQEHINLINEKPSIGKQLKEQLNKWVTTTPRYPANRIEITPSQETEEKLKALGYISNGNEEKLKTPPKGCTSCKPIPYKNQQ